MRDTWFTGLNVAPISAGDGVRFDTELDEHHWLGHRMVGETMRYVAKDLLWRVGSTARVRVTRVVVWTS